MDDYGSQPIIVFDDELFTVILLRNGVVEKFIPEYNFFSDKKISDAKINWTELVKYCDFSKYYGTVDLLKTLQWSDSNGKYAIFFFPKFIENS